MPLESGTVAVPDAASPETLQRLRALVGPHVDSFDWFISRGLSACVDELDHIEIEAGDERVELWISQAGFR